MKKKKRKKIKISSILVVLFFVFIIGLSIYMQLTKNNPTKYNKILKKISFEIPSNFDNNSENDRIRYSFDNDSNTSCYFEIEYFDTYGDYQNGGEYLKDYISFNLNDTISDIKEVNINNHKWYVLEKESKTYKEYCYATIYKGNGYYMEYEIYDYNHGDYKNNNNNFCHLVRNDIISSVKFK